MSYLPSFPQTSKPLRFATLLLTIFACIAATLPTAKAGDALTTSSTSSSTTTRKSILSSLFGSKSSSSSSTDTSTSSRINRSILGLPFGLLKTATSVVSKAASKTVTDHIKKY